MSDRPDPDVRAALRSLPVPEHGPDFWDRLDADLEGQTPLRSLVEHRVPAVRPITVAPTDDRGVALPLSRRRRRSNRLMAVAAAAAALVVVVAATALLRDQTGGEVDTAAPTTTGEGSPDEDPGVGSALQSTETSSPSLPSSTGRPGRSASRTVLAWLTALADADTETAWDLMAPDARAYWGGDESAFAAEWSALQEGYGAWGSAEPDILVETTLSSTDEGSIEIVTIVADVALEGPRTRRVLTMPVRVGPDGARVDPSPTSAAGIEPVSPPVRADGTVATIDTGSPLSVRVPSECDPTALRLDAGPAVTPQPEEAPSAAREVVSYRPSMEPGEHVLTIACVAEGGSVLAAGALFEAR